MPDCLLLDQEQRSKYFVRDERNSFIGAAVQVVIATGWHVIQGTPEFFSSTKKTPKGASVELSGNEKAVYEEIIVENALRLNL